jgi:hypothetical protein
MDRHGAARGSLCTLCHAIRSRIRYMLASDEAMVAWSKEGNSEDIPSVLSLFKSYEVRQFFQPLITI